MSLSRNGWRSERCSLCVHTGEIWMPSRILMLLASECTTERRRLPRDRRPANWDKIDDPVVLQGNQFVRPSVGGLVMGTHAGRITTPRKWEECEQLRRRKNYHAKKIGGKVNSCGCLFFSSNCHHTVTTSKWWDAKKVWLPRGQGGERRLTLQIPHNLSIRFFRAAPKWQRQLTKHRSKRRQTCFN